SPSGSPTASWAPGEAPEGTAARPKAPDSSTTSTSTVGLPRESRISRATMSVMPLMPKSPQMLGKTGKDRLEGIARQAACGKGPDGGKLGTTGWESPSSRRACPNIQADQPSAQGRGGDAP